MFPTDNKSMNNRLLKILSMLILMLVTSINVRAEELKLIKNLEGYWQFSIGDNLKWATIDFNDTDWDHIYAPKTWESQGYEGYNGYAWYRKTFKLSELDTSKTIILRLGKIDDVSQIFINGKEIGQNGNFHPNYKTAYDEEVKYRIPSNLLKENSYNVIAVRVYDSYYNGGIYSGPLGFYYDITNDLLEINLAGEWYFALSKPSNNINPKLSELDWTTIKVPGYWESQGFKGYDGYAVYSKKVYIPSDLAKEELVLVLGKIDDYDYAYFNGKLIGKVFDLKKEGAYYGKGNEYSALRGYRIPKELIKPDDTNTIIVKVYDYFKDGGIYEGPIGIMTYENFKYLKQKYYKNISIWDYIFD